MQLSVHTDQSCIISTILGRGTIWRCSCRTIKVCAFGRSHGSTIRLPEADAYGLSVRHADIATKAVQHIVLGSDGICLIYEVYEPTFLSDKKDEH